MAFLGVVLLALCFAEEVVELEPVNAANQNTFLCDQWDATTCLIPPGSSYCIWNSTANSGAGKCIDDPQLRVLQAGDDNPTTSSCTDAPDGVQGGVFDLTPYLDSDCAPSKGTGKICARSSKTVADFNYCVYAWLRDGVCPPSVCIRETSGAAGFGKNECIPVNVISDCRYLATETECGLTPKCFWNTSSPAKCQDDLCFGVLASGYDCDGKNVNGERDVCKLFKPWIGGVQVDYCVSKKQSNPNICYFGTPYSDPAESSNDFGRTYPTYNATGASRPVCTGTIGGTDCEGSGECTTILQAKGAFAGRYCTDGSHGSAGANILYIPSLLLLLTLSIVLAL